MRAARSACQKSAQDPSGKFLVRSHASYRQTWIENPHVWTRRAALVFTLPWAKEKRDPERMLEWAARLVDDREWFIQKAIGWWLRELSKRDPKRVRRFLTEHGKRLKGVAKREATKYLA